MMTAQKPLSTLTAADLMSRDVVTIPRAMSLHGAAHLLSQAQVSGAPVVDDLGRCIGVVSTTDFMQWMATADRAERCACSDAHSFHSAWEMVDVEELPADEVGGHMTADPVVVSPGTSIAELARSMIDAHIHRIIVVDGKRRPIGVVSSTDILAAVANAI
jgi:CBS-domain-containing membrane protein